VGEIYFTVDLPDILTVDVQFSSSDQNVIGIQYISH